MGKLIKGVALELGGEDFVVPPLALGDLELLQERLAAFSAAQAPTDQESVRTVIDATLAALQRNYPEMTRERLVRLLDVGNMHEAMLAVMGVSLPPAPLELGERPPVQGPSTGDASTPMSPPAPAGPSSTSEST